PWWGMPSAKLCHGPERRPAARGESHRHRAGRARAQRGGPARLDHLAAHPLRAAGLQVHGRSIRAPRALLPVDPQGGGQDGGTLAEPRAGSRVRALRREPPTAQRTARASRGDRPGGARRRSTHPTQALNAPDTTSARGRAVLIPRATASASVEDRGQPNCEDLTQLTQLTQTQTSEAQLRVTLTELPFCRPQKNPTSNPREGAPFVCVR